MKNPNNLLEDVKQCLNDPVFDIIKNFSLQKSKEFYSKWEEAWNSGTYTNNPAVKKEKETFPFKDLANMTSEARDADIFWNNIKEMPHCKNVYWKLEGNSIIVGWLRLKTFDEWLHDGLRDALTMASGCPEDGARQIIEKKLGKGIYSNTAIHMFAEGIITEEELKRLGTYERYMHMDDRDIEEDIKQAKSALEDMEENNVTVLTFKM